MDGRYTIGTANRYAMFLGEEAEPGDPRDIGKLVQSEKVKKALKQVADLKELRVNTKEVKEVAVKTEKKPVPVKVVVPVKNDEGEDMETVKNRRNREEKPTNDQKLRNGDVARPAGPPRLPRREGERRDDRREGDASRRDQESRPKRERREWGERDGEVEGRAAASARPRPRQSSRDPSNRRKREFERKSGSDKTGVKAVDKRDGAGAHNWGSHKDDVSGPGNLNTSDGGEEFDVGESKLEDTESVEKKEDGAPEIVEEMKELTLEEYRALRGKRNQPQFNLRRAGEGEDLSQWNGLVELEKKKKEVIECEDDEDLENLEFPQRVGRQKQLLDIDITFKEQRRAGKPARGAARTGPRDSREQREPREPREPRENRDNRDPTDRKNNYGPRRPFNGPREPKIENDTFASRNRDAAAPRVDDEKAFPSLG